MGRKLQWQNGIVESHFVRFTSFFEHSKEWVRLETRPETPPRKMVTESGSCSFLTNKIFPAFRLLDSPPSKNSSNAGTPYSVMEYGLGSYTCGVSLLFSFIFGIQALQHLFC